MKNKSKKITKTVLKGLLISGAIVISANNPRFFKYVLPKIIKYFSYKLDDSKKRKKVYDSFYQLKAKGLIQYEYRGKQMYIYLTEEGKKRAGKYQIDDLEIKKSKRWDKKWRVLIFDIKNRHKPKREALRGKIKDLGLYQLQKSVWVCPYEFADVVEILRKFFNLDKNEMQIISAFKIENDKDIKAFFGLK